MTLDDETAARIARETIAVPGMIDKALVRAGYAHRDAEVEELREWKSQAMEVLAGWEETFEAAGSPGPIGGRKSANVRAHIALMEVEVARLRAERDKARAEVEELRAERDAVLAGNHVPLSDLEAAWRVGAAYKAERDAALATLAKVREYLRERESNTAGTARWIVGDVLAILDEGRE